MLLTDHNADFLSRVEAFDRAADTVEAWEAEYGPAPGPGRRYALTGRPSWSAMARCIARRALGVSRAS